MSKNIITFLFCFVKYFQHYHISNNNAIFFYITEDLYNVSSNTVTYSLSIIIEYYTLYNFK